MHNKTIRTGAAGRVGKGLAAGAVLAFFLGACSAGLGRSGMTVSPELNVRGLTGEVSEVNIRVTGAGNEKSLTVDPSTNQVELELSPGEVIRFVAEAPIDSPGDEPVYSWGDIQHADLTAGESTELDLVMGPLDTKILVPQRLGFNLVQLHGMTITEQQPASPEWRTTSISSINYPTDAELDNQGRIWIGMESSPFLGWISSVTDSSINSTSFGKTVYGLSYSRSSGYLYFMAPTTDGVGVYRLQADSETIGTPAKLFGDVTDTISGIANIYPFGIAADDEGYVYITGADSNGNGYLYKIDPSDPRVVDKNGVSIPDSEGSFYYNNPDIVYKPAALFLTNPNGVSGEKILQFTPDLEFVAGFGTMPATPSGTGEFYKPARFIATTKRKIYLMDDGGFNQTRLVSFSDMDGNGWDTYLPKDSFGDDMFDNFWVS
jgi:hypothetical protein